MAITGLLAITRLLAITQLLAINRVHAGVAIGAVVMAIHRVIGRVMRGVRVVMQARVMGPTRVRNWKSKMTGVGAVMTGVDWMTWMRLMRLVRRMRMVPR